MRLRHVFAWLCCFLAVGASHAQEADRADQIQKIEAGLKWMSGHVVLGNGLAELDLTSDYRYLDPEDARKVIVDIWGNPPSHADTLGMLFPADVQPSQASSWGVVFTYKEDGYVKDDDAAKIDYDALLKQMQEAVTSENETRAKQNFPKIELIGWAAPPHYDQGTHKLYWAKEYAFAGEPVHTLNYDVRVLGRKGVLAINGVSSMEQLNSIQERMPEIISMVNFTPGNRYTDYQQGNDKVAAYGLAALILGGVAAKAGLFKGLLALILAGKKFIIIAVVAVGALLVRIFKRKKPANPVVNDSAVSNDPPNTLPNP